MGKLKFTLLVSLICMIVTACGKETITTGYTVMEEHITEDIDVVTICDDKYIYDYDRINNTLGYKRVNTYTHIKPAIYAVSVDDYTLGYIRPTVYYGTYEDFCGYLTYLYELGYKCKKLDADSNCYDIVLVNDEYQIRVIYQNSTEINILCINSAKSGCQPPYINGKGENTQ